MKKFIDRYYLTPLSDSITINNIITIHYFEYSKNYIFEGESHNFWEFLYVDKGEINVMADDRKYILKQGEMIFHKPNEWHNVIANGKVAPNLVVIAFECSSPAMEHFNDKVLSIDNKVKTYLSKIVLEAKNTFVSNIADPQLKVYEKREEIKFGSEQLIKIYLELSLLEIIRNEKNFSPVTRTSPDIREYVQEEKVNIIINFLKENINKQLTLTDISNGTLLSKSLLQKMFKECMNISIMEYFKQMKISRAKVLVRENNYNFTEISSMLGYSSIHYFSRSFKAVTGMTLTEYSNSVKSLIE